MPLPLILAGAALLAGGAGVAGMISAASDNSKAEDLVKHAKARFDEAEGGLRKAGQATNSVLAELGKTKLHTSTTLLKRVVTIADRVHVGKNQMKHAKIRGIEFTPETVVDMKAASIKATDILATGAASLTTGALAGVGALGVASAIGTASTGTAIGALSGAAASNATLAWLGGGAISAGGAGVAGGTAMLGGIVAGPILAVIGFAAAKHAEENLTQATDYAAKVDIAIEKIKTAAFKTKSIEARTRQISMVIGRLSERLNPLLENMEAVLDSRNPGKVSYGELASHEHSLYKTVLAFGSALYQVMEVDVIDELGEVTQASAKIIQEANEAMSQPPTASA